MANKGRIFWHQGFFGGLELELKEQKEILTFYREYELSKEAVRMDTLVIKKRKNEKILNPIGHIFRGHNVIEYKSPDDELTINTLYKVIGYAGLYKGLSATVSEIPVKELTISIFRHRYPRKLFSDLRELGASVTEYAPGIYLIDGVINVPLQIVVIGQLEKGQHTALTVLTKGADEDEIRSFICSARKFDAEDDKQNADAVLQVSVTANHELYRRVREESIMCEALEELMKDKIEEACEKACKQSQEKNNELKAEIAEKDASIAEKDASIAEKDAIIAELMKKLAEKE